ncbi:MAG: RtcB family protein [Calditrichota bacterium]
MSRKKLKPHKILSQYSVLDNFPEIARAAADYIRENPRVKKQDLLDWAEENYGNVVLLQPRTNAAPFEVFGEPGEHIPLNAVDQMYKVMRIPVATRGAMMPDAHLGYAMPIGGVVELENSVSPSFIGYDISCMMQLTLLDLPVDEFMQNRRHYAERLRDVTAFGMGADFADGDREHEVMESPVWEEIDFLKKKKSLAQKQLGSSGGGNHFADLVTIEFLRDSGEFSKGAEAVGLMTHSGSRGVGHKTATHYLRHAKKWTEEVARRIRNGYEWLSMDHDLGREYWMAMQLMGEYAKANHDLIHHHFCKAADVKPVELIWNRHNFAWLDEANKTVVHRKGATPAENGVLGIIPGSSGTPSYLVRGLGNEASLNSSSHGAGRWHSRTQAKKQHDEEAFRRHMEKLDIMHFGLEKDETFQAYKDIEMVIGLQDGVLIEPVARMHPKVVIMGGKADDGD